MTSFQVAVFTHGFTGDAAGHENLFNELLTQVSSIPTKSIIHWSNEVRKWYIKFISVTYNLSTRRKRILASIPQLKKYICRYTADIYHMIQVFHFTVNMLIDKLLPKRILLCIWANVNLRALSVPLFILDDTYNRNKIAVACVTVWRSIIVSFCTELFPI